MIYIEGYALISALGKSVEESVNRLRYNPILPQEIEEGIKYYKISDGEALPYYDVIEEVVKEAISHADIAQEEFLNMALFIGTSSAKLPLNEHHAKESGVLLI